MKVGRPAKWDNPEEFEKAVDDYFNTTDVPTWSGLALYLGFESRSSLQNYKERPEFLHTIKRALLRLEDLYEFRLNQSRNPTGAIFALKNFGWKDKHEVEQSGGIKIKFEEPGDYIPYTEDQGNNGIPESL
jgi:hypothetical protein